MTRERADIKLRQQKGEQACEILAELDLDCWLVWVRETMQMADPAMNVLLGTDVIGQTVLLFTRDGERIAIAQHHGALGLPSELFDRIVPYTKGCGESLRRELARLDPRHIAVNFSRENEVADGLSHGMYFLLLDYLRETPYGDRLVSAEELIEKLRGRKLPEKVDRIREAIEITERIFDDLSDYLKPGQTEREIAVFVNARMKDHSVVSAWDPKYCPAVDAGPDKEFGHAGPTDNRTRPGHLLHFDFGVRARGYCSDLQRMVFFGSPESVPEEVRDAFNTIREAIVAAASFIRPGRLGYEVDAVARNIVLQNGYEEFQHGLGHQIGQFAHDGGTRLAPLWELFGERPKGVIEEGSAFTIELNVRTNKHGQVSLEEDVLITANGCLFLSHPQEKLICIG